MAELSEKGIDICKGYREELETLIGSRTWVRLRTGKICAYDWSIAYKHKDFEMEIPFIAIRDLYSFNTRKYLNITIELFSGVTYTFLIPRKSHDKIRSER